MLRRRYVHQHVVQRALAVNLITDHLMNAMVIQDLATNMIERYRRIPLAQ